MQKILNIIFFICGVQLLIFFMAGWFLYLIISISIFLYHFNFNRLIRTLTFARF